VGISPRPRPRRRRCFVLTKLWIAAQPSSSKIFKLFGPNDDFYTFNTIDINYNYFEFFC
jgi:hypothetical protein